MAGVRAAMIALAFLLLPPVGDPAAADLNKIQPGDFLATSVADCTLNFVFDGPANKVYIGTAAHCVDKVGDVAKTTQYGVFGTVAWIGDADHTALDFAFIEVYPQFVDKVDPSVRGYPGWPTGYTRASNTGVGDRIQISGYGMLFDQDWNTQTKREGIHYSDTTSVYKMDGLDTFGDSGGPLVHKPTGKAYGIVSRACIDVCTSTGPTVEGILSNAARLGFPVTLRTA